MIIVTDVVPPGGWKYYQAETEYLIHSLDLREFRKMLEDHRRANKLDLSDGWWDRVQEEMAAADPAFAASHCSSGV